LQIFRHGDRTPTETYPTDPYRDGKPWPEGWGALTKVWQVSREFQAEVVATRISVLFLGRKKKDAKRVIFGVVIVATILALQFLRIN
jgi:hypothetical protein